MRRNAEDRCSTARRSARRGCSHGLAQSALRDYLGDERVHELAAPVSASEDFGSFGSQWGVPSVFWYVGGIHPDTYRKAEEAGRVADDIPTNHNPKFAPVIQPTLATGV